MGLHDIQNKRGDAAFAPRVAPHTFRDRRPEPDADDMMIAQPPREPDHALTAKRANVRRIEDHVTPLACEFLQAFPHDAVYLRCLAQNARIAIELRADRIERNNRLAQGACVKRFARSGDTDQKG